jgi:hypothetical protein
VHVGGSKELGRAMCWFADVSTPKCGHAAAAYRYATPDV